MTACVSGFFRRIPFLGIAIEDLHFSEMRADMRAEDVLLQHVERILNGGALVGQYREI